MRRRGTSGGSPVRALVGGVALLVVLQWYGPGGYSHMKTGQHKAQPPVEEIAPEVKTFGPYEVYGPFENAGKNKNAG